MQAVKNSGVAAQGVKVGWQIFGFGLDTKRHQAQSAGADRQSSCQRDPPASIKPRQQFARRPLAPNKPMPASSAKASTRLVE